MKYWHSPEWTGYAHHLIDALSFSHIPKDRVSCFFSSGSSSRRTIARIHGLPKVVQLGLNQSAFYVIELISERFDRQSDVDKTKTIIHELMHIPHSFNGGFRMHRPFVTHSKVDELYRIYSQKGAGQTIPGSFRDFF